MIGGFFKQGMQESMALQDQMLEKSWSVLKEQIRRGNGTNVRQNDQDPFGDGDQSKV